MSDLNNLLESIILEDQYNKIYAISEPNKEYNHEKFTKKYNILFVAGLSGSGKTTYAIKKAKEIGAIFIELDWLSYALSEKEFRYDKLKEIDQRSYDIMEEYIATKPKNDELLPFYKWLMKEHKNENFVCEGIQVYWVTMWDKMKDMPVTILMTSSLKSALRSMKRDKKYMNWSKPRIIKWYIEETKKLKEFIVFMEGE